MCGIAGILGVDGQSLRRAVSAMSAAQRHRGPDDCGEAHVTLGDRTLALGHRRLSIIDLSCAGHQPMVHPQTGDQLVFNGEIYNFAALRARLLAAGETLRGHGDAEVLLHALTRWGESCLAQLQGMYAFAFYDARGKRLLLARDPVGIKPLYVADAGGTLLFASEVRAILASGLVSNEIDRRGVAGLMAYGAVQHPLTLFESVRSFPPGCYQLIDVQSGAARPPVRFWDYPPPRAELTEADAVQAVRATLDEAVRDHLVADVPVGVFLSSGLDSTIVAALAAKHGGALRSFTVGFADQPDLSEHALAAETAALFGLRHTPITINGPDAEAALVAWLDALDQPSMDGFNVYIISRAVRGQGITVALSGQGGDELFGGYPSFADVPRLKRMMGYAAWAPPPLRGAISTVSTLRKPRAHREKMADILRTDGSTLQLYLQRRRAMSNRQLAALGIDAAQLGLTPGYLTSDAERSVRLGDDLVSAVSRLESTFYQGNMLLRDGDANGMAHSLEIRVPLLDQRMLDLAHSIPGRVRLPSGNPDKHLLRAAFGDVLRPALLRQAKRGFTLPLRRWMLGPLRDLAEAALRTLKRSQVLRPEGVDAVWAAYLAEPESPTWSRAFTLCVLGHYIGRTRDAVPSAATAPPPPAQPRA